MPQETNMTFGSLKSGMIFPIHGAVFTGFHEIAINDSGSIQDYLYT
jgi:hypothetical protein